MGTLFSYMLSWVIVFGFTGVTALAEPCDVEAITRGNWKRVEEFQSNRPKLPPVSEGKVAFEAYRKAMAEYRKGLDSLTEEVKKQNHEIIYSPSPCRADSPSK
jgi:hypothetical protein